MVGGSRLQRYAVMFSFVFSRNGLVSCHFWKDLFRASRNKLRASALISFQMYGSTFPFGLSGRRKSVRSRVRFVFVLLGWAADVLIPCEPLCPFLKSFALPNGCFVAVVVGLLRQRRREGTRGFGSLLPKNPDPFEDVDQTCDGSGIVVVLCPEQC